LDNNGCSNQVSAAIQVTATPQASITPLVTLCSGAGTQLLVGQPNGGNFSGPGVNFGVFNPSLAGAGMHTVTYEVNVNGCISIDSIQVEVSQTPTQPLIQVQGGVLLSSANDSNQWYFNGQPIVGATGNSYQPMQNGLYQVRVRNGACVSILSTAFEVLNVSVQSLEAAGIGLYPNPSQGQVQLDLSAYAGGVFKLEIRNTLGQLIFTAEEQVKEQFIIDLQNQAAGLYFVQVMVQGQQFVGRLLLQK